VDDNVHFQDTARLVQRLIELGKDFDVMYYPAEPHTVQTEASRTDQSRRAIRFFDRYLRGPGAPSER
jgi:dipeptidyl-peptidase-4